MTSERERKNAPTFIIRRMVERAIDRGVKPAAIAKGSGLPQQYIYKLRKGTNLSHDNVVAVETWLRENGHWEETPSPAPKRGDPWALPITRLSALLDTLRDPAIPDPEKARAFSFEIGYLSGIIKAALKETGHEVP